jgi:hypothetical protein
MRNSWSRTCNQLGDSSQSSFLPKSSKLTELTEIDFKQGNSGFFSTGNNFLSKEKNLGPEQPKPPRSPGSRQR